MKYFLFPLIAIIAPNFASAQDWITREACEVPSIEITNSTLTPTYLSERAAEFENGIGRLWRVTSQSGKTSHLWGTMHTTHPEVLDLPAKLVSLIETADTVALEFDPTFKSRAAFEKATNSEGFWAQLDFPRPPEFMRDDVDSWVRARLDGIGYKDSIGFLSLGALATLLLGDPCDDFWGGLILAQDYEILRMGIKAGAAHTGLEEEGFLMNDLNSYNRRAEVVAMIKVYGAYLDPVSYETPDGSGLGLYKKGHIAGLMGWDRDFILDFYGQEEGAKLEQLVNGYLVDERNRLFLPKTLELLEKGNALIAVGSFHLPGDAGLVTLLREAGYTVDRVPVEGEIGFK
ncbi:TraB/GumN family protein [Amylibacter sp. IMCC11727]|uniref:TraB/GumN family protein n=1 Tax=Amylibacter sp. IMCC11727 TaxID=3039851 RepID=UPI00244DF65A|nr:TraB/GumN family protein [Amylibacter sp. IMCC11727]WGI21678.1 TraB/GumN family protein [Amylibacter sp. IMCC11727]